MSSLADVNTAMRERVTHLERRYGRKRVYLVSGIVAILVVLSAIRVITSRQKAVPPPAPRSVTVAKVVTKDVPPHTVVGGVPAKIIKSIDGGISRPDRTIFQSTKDTNA